MQRPKQRQNIPDYIRAIKEAYSLDDFPPRFSFRFLVKHPDFGFESLNDSNKIALYDEKFFELSCNIFNYTAARGALTFKIATKVDSRKK